MKQLLFVTFVSLTLLVNAQKPVTPTTTGTPSTPIIITPPGLSSPPKTGPKPYKEIITDKAITKKGLFVVHKIDDKYYFEIPDSLLGREILAVTRFSKVAGGAGQYGGDLANQQSLEFEKGPSNNIFLRVVTLISTADSSQEIYKAVSNSYLNPIAAAFDIKAYGKDSSSSIIDVTDFFKGDNQIVSISPSAKRRFNATGLATDRSYIQNINTYPINTEIRTVKTFNASPSSGGLSFGIGSTPPAADAAGAITFELNTSLLLLPKEPMHRRLFDPRVGYFADKFTVYGDDQQKISNQTFAIHWRMEPKPEDIEKYKRGELVEPAKPIIYYIDPATPRKWRSYMIAGVNDWQKAFEKAGFKNAIMAKEWPTNDTTMGLEDARFSVIRYFASDIENAYGPNVHDPRSGEILESHIGWYHNILKLLHDWYMIQTAAVDPRARKMKFDDDLMGQLVRLVITHEVGHTLGLRHNMGSSSTTTVEDLRNKAWVEANGHTPSIMDYARYNYVAQPEDNISEAGLLSRMGEYDNWAIQWGYTYTGIGNVEEDKKVNNKWIVDSLTKNHRLWFGGEGYSLDPRAQAEDIGDNAMKAGEYGIKNLKRIMSNLPTWTKEEADQYDNLSDMYGELTTQFQRYMSHVSRNVGGIYETFKSVEEQGDVYDSVPKARQKEAVAFLNKQLFETPMWLLDKNVLNKISNPAVGERVQNIQGNVVRSLLSGDRLQRLIAEANRFGTNSYSPDEMLNDVKKGVWGELTTKKIIDSYRRSLQKEYLEAVIRLTGSAQSAQQFGSITIFGTSYSTTDIPSIAKAHLRILLNEINASLPLMTDKMSKYHLQDCADRIKQALNPNRG
jgi:hypothetical protein